ncbi:MAG: hypothetical protein ACJATI_004144 [Halioglobus sp.]|jgi:hypothetical protein
MKKELTYNQIDKFFRAPDEWEIEMVDSKILKCIDLTKTQILLINKLNSDDGQIRYIASHIILTFKLEEAKNKLIERILNKNTYNHNGTMTYALGHLNCSDNLVDVFKILATQSYESKLHAYNILSEQEFEFTEGDLSDLTEIWNKLKSNQDGKSKLESETFEMIRDAYEGFIKYIEEK